MAKVVGYDINCVGEDSNTEFFPVECTMTTLTPLSFEIGDLRASFPPAVLTNKWIVGQCITETHSVKHIQVYHDLWNWMVSRRPWYELWWLGS